MSVSMQDLEVFVGAWDLVATFEGMDDVPPGRSTFEWMWDGTFLVERSEVDHPDAPNGFVLVAPNADGDGYIEHYFDSRGVARVYEMSFDGTTWTLTRDEADFTPLDFAQRYTGVFSEDKRTITGVWEICHDGKHWEKDFDLNYVRRD